MNAVAGALTRNTRWLGRITLVFLAQIGFIVWLSDPSPSAVRKPSPAPTIALAGPDSLELLALNDPTLFALPHFRGFSGGAWMKAPPAPNRSFEWAEEPRWLTPGTQAFPRPTVETNIESLNAFEVASPSSPEPSFLISAPPQFRKKSTMRIAGPLARRKLILLPELPSWSSTNLLTNTVVRIMVNAEGLPRSATLLVGSGLKEADDQALKTTRELRFENVAARNTETVLGWGEVVFQWHGTGKTNK